MGSCFVEGAAADGDDQLANAGLQRREGGVGFAADAGQDLELEDVAEEFDDGLDEDVEIVGAAGPDEDVEILGAAGPDLGAYSL